MVSWWNELIKFWFDQMLSSLNGKMLKWWVNGIREWVGVGMTNEMTGYWNDYSWNGRWNNTKLMKQLINKTTSWWNDELWNHQ